MPIDFAVGEDQIITGLTGDFFLAVESILQWCVLDIVNQDLYRSLSLKSQKMI